MKKYLCMITNCTVHSINHNESIRNSSRGHLLSQRDVFIPFYQFIFQFESSISFLGIMSVIGKNGSNQCHLHGHPALDSQPPRHNVKEFVEVIQGMWLVKSNVKNVCILIAICHFTLKTRKMGMKF